MDTTNDTSKPAGYADDTIPSKSVGQPTTRVHGQSLSTALPRHSAMGAAGGGEEQRLRQKANLGQNYVPTFTSDDGKKTFAVSAKPFLSNPLLEHFVLPPGRAEGFKGEQWHQRLNRFLHDWRTHLVLNVLLILDVIFIIVGISLELAFLESEVNDLESQCEDVSEDLREECSSHPGNTRLEDAAKGIEYASLAILILFAIDNMLLLVANGWGFFKCPLYVFDTLVIFAAIILEVTLANGKGSPAGILVVVRTWRFIRIGHGVFETSHEVEAKHHDEIVNNLLTEREKQREQHKQLQQQQQQQQDKLRPSFSKETHGQEGPPASYKVDVEELKTAPGPSAPAEPS
uniref:Hydrogen voltage-gated channel 1 n=1 Tax=Lotharella globosa TaxID=91324 RepID=A0A7S3YUZ7_9EUKA|mmetsp:Transcript_18540/g.37474  ORF Transcript_18540/g.37474 Transcript_18540/m.37474 type:complete len:345 (+) Transcript_18540:84-1118(+)